MEFTTKKPPIVQNSQRTYKRSLNLHFALLVVAVVAIILPAFIKLGDASEVTNLDLVFKTFFMLSVGVAISIIVEVLYAYVEGTLSRFDSYKGFVDPINTGLLIALLLPTSTPIYVLIVSTIVGVYAGKLVFGGYGYYIFNPALVGALFASLSFPLQVTYGDTPLVLLKQAMAGETVVFTSVTELFVGNYQAIAIGSTSVILLTLVFVYLAITKVIDLRISGTFLLSVLVMSLGIGYINGFLVDYTIINVISGLTLFGAVFLISESITSPTSRETKIIYAVIVAIMMMMVRVLGENPEGLIFAVLLGNMITPFINRTVKRSNKKTLIKTVVIMAVIVVLVTISLGFILQSEISEVTASIGGILL